jgi:hypothetical protein
MRLKFLHFMTKLVIVGLDFSRSLEKHPLGNLIFANCQSASPLSSQRIELSIDTSKDWANFLSRRIVHYQS